jgi:hypothetical protein
MNTRNTYEVWKERDREFKFKTPHGIETFKTKRDANIAADAWKRANAHFNPPKPPVLKCRRVDHLGNKTLCLTNGVFVRACGEETSIAYSLSNLYAGVAHGGYAEMTCKVREAVLTAYPKGAEAVRDALNRVGYKGWMVVQ